jgi:hypothetical protein
LKYSYLISHIIHVLLPGIPLQLRLIKYWYRSLVIPPGTGAILILILFFTGCNPHMVNKDVHPLVVGNDSYSISVQGIEPQTRWWEALNDRFLNALVVEALSENLTLKQAHSRIEQAIADDKQAASFLYPDITGEASAGSEWRGKDKPEDSFDTRFALSWEIDLWGRMSSARKSAGYEILASRLRLLKHISRSSNRIFSWNCLKGRLQWEIHCLNSLNYGLVMVRHRL